jgi:hypothetical protein
MVLEPLDISNPHPFISLLGPLKGQRLFPRVIRHLSGQQSMTLLTLLVATYAQLDVVIRAPPPPAADASLLTKADRLDRAKREAETENFLHCVVPVVDNLIGRCGLGLVSGLLGICVQRMEVARVASTRVSHSRKKVETLSLTLLARCGSLHDFAVTSSSIAACSCRCAHARRLGTGAVDGILPIIPTRSPPAPAQHLPIFSSSACSFRSRSLLAWWRWHCTRCRR